LQPLRVPAHISPQANFSDRQNIMASPRKPVATEVDARAQIQADSAKIVSSEHLAQVDGWQLSEYEYGLIVAHNAFTRWMVRCITAVVGHGNFNPLDVLVLHNVNHRRRPKRLGDITFVLNIEDQHTVTYALKKLTKAGLVESERRGKERFYRTTNEGIRVCGAYRDLRKRCLLDTFLTMEREADDLRHIADLLRGLSGLYDQAARAASSV